NDYYKVSRLPWILYQYVFRQLFEPAVASYLIQYSCLALGGISVLYTCRLLRFGDTAAFLASIFLLTYGWYIGAGSGGADYHNTLAAPLYAASFLATTMAACRPSVHRSSTLVGAGCLYALAVHSSIFYLNFVPILVVQFVSNDACRRSVAHSAKTYIFGLLIGGFLTTAALGLINRAAG